MDRILFIVPNINYHDFIKPPDNVKRVSKKSDQFVVLITDIPLDINAMKNSVMWKKQRNTQILQRRM